MIKDSPFLDKKYTVFGEVVKGMEVADKIANLQRDSKDIPIERVEMKIKVVNVQEQEKSDLKEEAKFAKAAQDYHDAATKPMLPEEARKFKVQAEQSVGDKKFDDAAELYGKALAIAPWWPEGHFNRAIVLGESRYYRGAMREMKRYLTLVPNAPNARAAQDKIYAWELKAGK